MKISSPTKSKTTNYLSATLGFLSIFLFWLVLGFIQDNQIVFPNLFLTLSTLGGLFSKSHTYLVLLNSIGGVFLVLVLSFIVAIVLALFSLKWPHFKSFMTPILALLKIVPVPALIILFLANFKQGFIPYLLTFLVILPLVYDGLYGAFISINKDIIDELKLLSKLSLKIIFEVYLPIVGKAFISTLLQAFGLGLKIKVMSEFIAEAPNTIGYELSYGRATLSMDIVFAWSLILILFVIIFDYWLVNRLKKLN
jgi:NitT/TauT family transport system permease protein